MRILKIDGLTLIVIVALMLFTSPTPTDAMPAFARKYKMSCTNCHQMSFPKLNPFGRQFKENGFQMPKGAEDPAVARTMTEPGTLQENLAIFKEIPLSIRARQMAFVPQDADKQGADELNLRFPDNVFLFGGGSLYRNVSLLFSYSLAPDTDLHYAYFGLHNLLEDKLGEMSLNVRAGKYLLLDWMRPEHRHLTQIGHIISQVQVGDNPFIFDSHQAGVEFYGRPNAGPVFYEVGIVEGAMDHGTGQDLDRLKDPYVRLTYTHKLASSWSYTSYFGKARITKENMGVTRRFDDRFNLQGFDFDVPVGPTVLFAHILRGDHQNPSGTGESVEYWGYHGEVDWSIAPNWIGIVRYDRVVSDDDVILERQVATMHLSVSRLTNLRFALEYNFDLDDSDLSKLIFFADAAF